MARCMRRSTQYVGGRLMGTFLAANPFGGVTLVIMSVAGEAVPMRAERDAVLIEAALETGERQIIAIGVAQTDGAQSMQIVIDKLQDFFMAFARITEHFTDLEGGKTLLQILKPRNGQQVVVAIRRRTWTAERPEESEPIIHDVEGFGFVAEVMFPARDGDWLLFGFLRGIGIGCGLIGASVIHISRLGIAPSGKAAMLEAGRRIAGAAFFGGLARRTEAL